MSPGSSRSASLGMPFIDLTGDFNAVPEADRAALFLQKGELDYPGSEGHYTVAGNELVARALLVKLAPHLPQ